MNNAFSVLINALIDSFRPRMLILTLGAVAAALIFWLVLIWLAMDPLSQWILQGLGSIGLDTGLNGPEESGIYQLVKVLIVPLVVMGLLWPIVASSAVMLAGLYVTPAVLSYLSKRDFPDLKHMGRNGMVRSLWVTLKSVIVFLVGWIVTLPLWLIPGMAFVIPLILAAYLLISVMRFDALADHASPEEYAQIKKLDSSSAWLIGLVCAFLSFVPPILLIMPVMSALAFTRFYLKQLESLRALRGVGQVIEQ